MKIDEITAKYFSNINPENGKPLYLQIKEKVAEFIEDNPDSTLFPSERQLADALQLNRRTIRKALAPFVENGQLQRGPRGTITNKGNINSDASIDNMHPFTLSLSKPIHFPKHNLKLLLYETMPYQIEFWQSVIKEFNDSQAEFKIEAVWPKANGDLIANFWNEFQSRNYDLVHLPVSYLWPEYVYQTLLRIPSQLRKSLTDEKKFRSISFCESVPEMLEVAIPFCYSFSFMSWNKKYLNAMGVGNFDDFSSLSFDDKLRIAVDKLPEDVFLSHRFYDLVHDLGLPKSLTCSVIEEHYRIAVKRALMLRKRHGAVFPETVPTKNNEKILMQHDFSSVLPLKKHLLDRSLYFSIPESLSDTKYWGGTGSLGIFPQSNHKAAISFINFMLSEKVQCRIARELCMAPAMTAAADELAAVLNTDFESFDKYLWQIRETPSRHANPVGIVIESQLKSLLAGNISENELLEYVMEYYNLNLSLAECS